MVVVLDADEVVCLPFVPVCRPERGGRLDVRVVFRRGDDNRQLLCRVVVLPQVVDGFVPVVVLLCRDQASGRTHFLFQRREDFLNLIGTDDESFSVDVFLTVEDVATGQVRERVVITAVLRNADIERRIA